MCKIVVVILIICSCSLSSIVFSLVPEAGFLGNSLTTRSPITQPTLQHPVTPHPAFSFVFFYSSTCPHCQRFAPILKHTADALQMRVYPVSLDGQSLPSFPKSETASPELVATFFSGLPSRGVPALFILDTENGHVYPISQGELSSQDLVQRLNQILPKIINHEEGDHV